MYNDRLRAHYHPNPSDARSVLPALALRARELMLELTPEDLTKVAPVRGLGAGQISGSEFPRYPGSFFFRNGTCPPFLPQTSQVLGNWPNWDLKGHA